MTFSRQIKTNALRIGKNNFLRKKVDISSAVLLALALLALALLALALLALALLALAGAQSYRVRF